MKKIIMLIINLTGLSISSFATASSVEGNKSLAFEVSYGSTHYVKPYIRRDGTYVQGHRSGNPGSGVHCQNDVCY